MRVHTASVELLENNDMNWVYDENAISSLFFEINHFYVALLWHFQFAHLRLGKLQTLIRTWKA